MLYWEAIRIRGGNRLFHRTKKNRVGHIQSLSNPSIEAFGKEPVRFSIEVKKRKIREKWISTAAGVRCWNNKLKNKKLWLVYIYSAQNCQRHGLCFSSALCLLIIKTRMAECIYLVIRIVYKKMVTNENHKDLYPLFTLYLIVFHWRYKLHPGMTCNYWKLVN